MAFNTWTAENRIAGRALARNPTLSVGFFKANRALHGRKEGKKRKKRKEKKGKERKRKRKRDSFVFEKVCFNFFGIFKS